MGLCETIANLADAVERDLFPTEARHRLLLTILRSIPLYRDIGDLAAWDAAFRNALEDQDDESLIGNTIWEIFDFSAYNMYGAFDAVGTRSEYESLAKCLTRRGVCVPSDAGLTDW